jgi:hypothetical protein
VCFLKMTREEDQLIDLRKRVSGAISASEPSLFGGTSVEQAHRCVVLIVILSEGLSRKCLLEGAKLTGFIRYIWVAKVHALSKRVVLSGRHVSLQSSLAPRFQLSADQAELSDV